MGESLYWLLGWKTERLGDEYLEAFIDPEYTNIAQQMLSLGHELSHAGALPGTSGNFSVRVGENFIITPQGFRKGELKPETLVIVVGVDRSEKIVKFISERKGAQPSSDTLLHHYLYVALSDCFAIVHPHVGIDGPGVQLPYPVTQQEEVNPLVAVIREGSRAVNLLNHSPAEGGNGASIIVGEDMEETFRQAIWLANRTPLF